MPSNAPLWWSSGRSGGRLVDKWLRDKYRSKNIKVLELNSLWGSVLVQGAMFVVRMREEFSEVGTVGLTETHPKAVLKALKLDAEGAFFQEYGVQPTSTQITEHERDAVISAVAAREGFEGRWAHDLSEYRYPCEQDPVESWLGPVHYYWPHKR